MAPASSEGKEISSYAFVCSCSRHRLAEKGAKQLHQRKDSDFSCGPHVLKGELVTLLKRAVAGTQEKKGKFMTWAFPDLNDSMSLCF